MKTLLLSEIFPPQTGGSGRWLYEVYSRLPREKVVVVTHQHAGHEEYDRGHTVPVVRVPLTFPSWSLLSTQGLRSYWQALRGVRRLVKEHQVSAIHCGRCIPEGVVAMLLGSVYRLPYLCYVHGEELTTMATSRELGWWTRRALHGAKLLIANSENTAGILRRDWQLPADRVQVMHPGVDTQRFTPGPRDAAVRARLGWEGRTVVLTVGRLQKRKGQDMLIRALPRIKEAVPDVLYAIVGDGEEREPLQRLIEETQTGGQVQMLGEVTDAAMQECYQQCDLFALPNRQIGSDIEGFGMVLVEAQACGRPVLAGASGGTAETMRIPETGRVVPCEEPVPLAAAVVELLSDRARLDQMGAAGREWAVEHLDWAALTRQALGLFERLEVRPQGRAG